jgi:hypothetical protein
VGPDTGFIELSLVAQATLRSFTHI